MFSKIKNKFQIDNIDLAAYFLAILFVVVFTFLSFGRHDSLKSYLNDIGPVDQVIWNTAHGRFFEITTSMYDENHYLAGHFSPILLFFVPFYFIFASPKWLLFFQALAAGLSSIPVFWLAKEKLKSAWLGLLLLISYLFYPILHNGLLYDFHEVVFATLFVSFAFYFLEKGKDKWFIFFSVLLALSQEHLPLLVFMMGLYLIFFKKRYKFGLAVSMLSLAYFFLVLFVLMPHLSSSGIPALLTDNSMYLSRYGWLGKSVPEILEKILERPWMLFAITLLGERPYYMFQLVLPVFSLALYSPVILIILPLFFINVLSNNSMTFCINFYHSAIFAPIIYFSSIFTLKKWFFNSPFLRKLFVGFILIFSVASSAVYGLSPLSRMYGISDFIPSRHAREIEEIKKIIPKDASLSVQNNLGPHFTERELVYRFPVKKDEVEYILLDGYNPYQDNPQQLVSFEYAMQVEMPEWKAYVDDLRQSELFDIAYEKDGWLLFKRK